MMEAMVSVIREANVGGAFRRVSALCSDAVGCAARADECSAFFCALVASTHRLRRHLPSQPFLASQGWSLGARIDGGK